MRVLMSVVSNISTDARVKREATSVAEAGHDVIVVGFQYGLDRLEERTERGVTYVLFPFPSRDTPRRQRLAGAGRFFVRAARYIGAADADVYHSHNLHLAIPMLCAARRRGGTFVYEAHELVGGMLKGWKRVVGIHYERFIWRRSAAVITTNSSRRRYLTGLHHGHDPVVLGNYPEIPAELNARDLRAEIGVPPGRKLLIYQGGFYVEGRCFDTIALALRDLPDWHWVLVGFGSSDSLRRLNEYMENAGIAERVTILPEVPVAELLPIAAGADLGVVPLHRTELNNYLGDTNKLFEYMAAGIPAIGSDFPEVRGPLEGNGSGAVGAVFDPASPGSIVAAVKSVEPRLEVMKPRAYALGRERYSWDVEKKKLQDLYQAIMANRSSQTSPHGRAPRS